IELMVDAARAAAADAGAPRLLEQVQLVAAAGGWFRYRNPAQLVAERIGAPDAATVLSATSGTAPQDMVALAAERIARGDLDVALVVGGEARWSHQRLKREGLAPPWTDEPGTGEPEPISAFSDEMMSEATALGAPVVAYALFEDSLRSSSDETIDVHRERIAALWAGFSEVAASNPFAWDRTPRTSAEVGGPTPQNRMIAFPYTKAMVANNTVDMASALLLCSVVAARAAGVERDRLVFPHVVTSGHETWRVIERHDLHGCPALSTAGRAAFAHAGLGPDDIEHIDLYACFPAIVQMSAQALGLGFDRPLTVTGGLGFAGGAVANAVGHSIAAMVPRVRDGGWGLVHGNGGLATKHSFAVYADHPPTAFARIDVQDAVDHAARRELPADWSGRAVVDAATVVYDREGPAHVIAAVRDGDGRAWARSTDAAVIATTMDEGLAGAVVHRGATGTLEP
ncbi:MAG: hypothetical protein ABW328_18595, partial [Ilumatobacteraceae bacterium]